MGFDLRAVVRSLSPPRKTFGRNTKIAMVVIARGRHDSTVTVGRFARFYSGKVSFHMQGDCCTTALHTLTIVQWTICAHVVSAVEINAMFPAS